MLQKEQVKAEGECVTRGQVQCYKRNKVEPKGEKYGFCNIDPVPM